MPPDRKFGSLLNISHTYVLFTAGYCMKLHVTISNETVPIDMLEVVLGRFNLNPLRADRSANRKVASYVIHPDYVHYLKADSDLTDVTLKNVVEFTPLIRPICLWSGSSKLEDVVSRTGYVVGWANDNCNRRDLDDQRMVRATIVSQVSSLFHKLQEICLWTDSRFIFTISDNTFCAGSQDGLGPCRGDAGNGLILVNNITNSYELRGVVSRSLINETSFCGLLKYFVYVDVAKYTPWIQQQISI
ncbi:PREDICTED: serine protease gd-like isoform X1 [Vollenhovia emeryi]|uniref:serine protease gd-like isoform X1 n=1 Tax=Vollenhovia emeryi TaxID=411798 RepID=UPI0005F3E04F|nr:PREDICTED: serine protease gd-like isoform X1 [Vollenhovia emeryi]